MSRERTLKPVPLADKVDDFIHWVGHGVAWSYAVLIAVIIAQVILRKGFQNGLIALEELQWHLYAIGVMFGMTYAQSYDSHVRVDLFFNKFSPKWQHIIEILGILFLLLPFLWVIFYHSLDFVADSWRTNERSAAPAGLPYRWIIKSVIPVSIGMLMLAAVNRIYREVALLIKGE